ncbi:MAG: 3-dehydroquinate synthase [Clostridia bacterium]|nr:3-dehydroquinate synthase [Clostridia bacterium]
MKAIRVDASRAYDVCIERGILQKAGTLMRAVKGNTRFMVVTDSNVSPLYLDALVDTLGDNTASFVFPAGEQSKTLSTFGNILEHMAGVAFTRADTVVALGGGVVGDMAGFAAACYLRGVDFIQIPTTFLSAIDSSVGGKTGVDLSAGKNLAGAFLQPSLVLIDPDTFQTLPTPVFNEGTAEALKYGVLYDPALFTQLAGGDFNENIESIVQRCVELKAAVVHEDEFDRGERRMLNLGHTFGHAVEARSGFSLYHGEGVGIGMLMAARVSERLGIAVPGVAQSIREALLQNHLPTRCAYDARALCSAACVDKKRMGDTLTLILIEHIGKCVPYPIPISDLLSIMKVAAEDA